MNVWKLSGIVILVLLAFSIIGYIARGCNTAREVVDKKVLNSDHIIYTYEEFHNKHQQYVQYDKQLVDAKAEMTELETKGITSGQRYDNLSMEIDGIRNMKNRIAAEYNAMTEINWDNMWKEKGLPEHLE